MDSAVLLAETVQHHGPDNVAALSFDYGQRHAMREGNAAARLAEHYHVTRTLIRIPAFGGSILKRGEGSMVGASTVVPFRNGILLACAVGYAASIGASRVLMGCHVGDNAIYPDCRRGFIALMHDAAIVGTAGAVAVGAPFVERGWSKREIAAEGNRLRVPWEMTWSCYLGGETPCGECGACIERDAVLKPSG